MRCRHWCVLSAALCAIGSIGSSAGAHEVAEPITADVAAPVLIDHVEPVYPELARKLGLRGSVGLEIKVDEGGSVFDVKITRLGGFGFDEAAVVAAKQMRFRPALRDGKPIASVLRFEQQFFQRPQLEAASQPASAPSEVADATPASRPALPSFETYIIGRAPTSAASAATIRNQDFDLRPKTSPNDLLLVVPGLLAVQHQGGGKADQLFLRGFDADHGTDVAVYVDGIPVNMPSHAHGQGFADLHWLIPEAVDHIEVNKGSYELKYGDFATAGAVNIVTRDTFASSSVQYTLGMLPTIAGRAVSAGRFVGIVAPELPDWAAKLHPWIAVEAAYDNGPFVASENLQRYNIFSKLSYDFTPRLTAGMFFQAYGSGWTGSGQIPAREVQNGDISQFGSEDPSEGEMTERQMFTSFLRYKGEEQDFELSAYVTRYRLKLWNDFTFFLRDPVNGDEIEQDDARTFTGARLAYHFHRHIGQVLLRTTVGAEMRYDGIHVDRWDAESQNGDFRKRLGRLVSTDSLGGNDDDINQTNTAAYVEEDVVFNRHFRLIGGVRVDYFGFAVDDLDETLGAGQPNTSGTRQFTTFSPKASAVISVWPELLDLYVNFGEGFHSNQAEVALLDGKKLVDADGTTFTVHALPKYYSGEIGARSRLFGRLDLAAAVWASHLENETVFDADDATFVPSAPTQRAGVDAEARLRILDWLFADLDLAQAKATTVGGGELALAPKIYMTGGLTVKHPSGFRAGLRFRFLGDRPAFDEDSPEYQYFTSKKLANGQPNPDYNPARVTAQGYFIMDAYVSYRWRFLEASLAIQNLLNSTWREAQFGNRSCTRDETYNPQNPNYAGSGNKLSDGSYVDRCGIAYATDPAAGGANTRSGVVDVHYTPGIPFNLQLTLKAYF